MRSLLFYKIKYVAHRLHFSDLAFITDMEYSAFVISYLLIEFMLSNLHSIQNFTVSISVLTNEVTTSEYCEQYSNEKGLYEVPSLEDIHPIRRRLFDIWQRMLESTRLFET